MGPDLKSELAEQEFEAFRGSRIWRLDRPKDPACSDVSLLLRQIWHANGRDTYDANDWAMAGINGTFLALESSEDHRSLICSEPGVLIRTCEAQFSLTAQEADRLARNDLLPEEFFAICDAVGCLWLTHDDYYDPETGEALQPLRNWEASEDDFQ